MKSLHDDIELENALLCPNDSCSCQRLRACKDEDEDPENIVDLTLAGSAFSPPSLLANQPARDATDLSECKLSCETCNTMYTFQERNQDPRYGHDFCSNSCQ